MVRKAKTGKKQGGKKAAKSTPAKAKSRAISKALATKAKPKPKPKAKAKPKAKGTTAKKVKAQKTAKAVKVKAKPVTRKTSRAKKALIAATTSDILTKAPGVPAVLAANSIPRKWQRHYRILTDLRDTLLEQSGRLVREAHEEAVAHSMHMADAGTDSFDRDFALSLLSADQNALTEVEAAIQRIRTGEYGVCEMTGRPIGQDRLEAIPWTRFSYEAQQQLEKSGVGDRVHLGSLRTVHGGDTAEVKEDADEEEEKKEAE